MLSVSWWIWGAVGAVIVVGGIGLKRAFADYLLEKLG
jgi:hypothetical protein